MARKRTTYDPHCYELAGLFLADEPRLRTHAHADALAQLIQRTIEEYIEHERSTPSPESGG